MEMKDFYNNLSDEQKQKFKKCKTQEEFLKFAEDCGLELSDEVLDSLTGGYHYTESPFNTCPKAVDFDGKPCPPFSFQ